MLPEETPGLFSYLIDDPTLHALFIEKGSDRFKPVDRANFNANQCTDIDRVTLNGAS